MGNGKLNGMSMRVPVICGSVVDATFVLEKETDYDAVCAPMKAAAEGPMKGVLGYCTDKIVSSDCLGDSRSSIFDVGASMMMGKTLLKVIAWYDNEWDTRAGCWICAHLLLRRTASLNEE